MTLELVEAVGYDGAFTFVFSPRRETEAGRSPTAWCPTRSRSERMERLVEVVQRRAHERAQRFVGPDASRSRRGTLANRPERLRGRTRHNKAVNFTGRGQPGEFVEVAIERGDEPDPDRAGARGGPGRRLRSRRARGRPCGPQRGTCSNPTAPAVASRKRGRAVVRRDRMIRAMRVHPDVKACCPPGEGCNSLSGQEPCSLSRLRRVRRWRPTGRSASGGDTCRPGAKRASGGCCDGPTAGPAIRRSVCGLRGAHRSSRPARSGGHPVGVASLASSRACGASGGQPSLQSAGPRARSERPVVSRRLRSPPAEQDQRSFRCGLGRCTMWIARDRTPGSARATQTRSLAPPDDRAGGRSEGPAWPPSTSNSL